MNKDWKTTLAGLLTILLPIVLQLLGVNVPSVLHAATIPMGVGLLLAKDAQPLP